MRTAFRNKQTMARNIQRVDDALADREHAIRRRYHLTRPRMGHYSLSWHIERCRQHHARMCEELARLRLAHVDAIHWALMPVSPQRLTHIIKEMQS